MKHEQITYTCDGCGATGDNDFIDAHFIWKLRPDSRQYCATCWEKMLHAIKDPGECCRERIAAAPDGSAVELTEDELVAMLERERQEMGEFEIPSYMRAHEMFALPPQLS